MADDVTAALAVLEQAASERETAQERIHARAAHALVAQALADAGQAARLALLHEANDVLCGGLSSSLNLEHMRDMHDRVLLADARAQAVDSLRPYLGHLPECELFAGVNAEGCYNPGPCSCGLAALLPKETT